MGVYLRNKSLYSAQKAASCVIFFYTEHFDEERKWEYVFPRRAYLYMLTYTDANSICHTVHLANIFSKDISVAHHEK